MNLAITPTEYALLRSALLLAEKRWNTLMNRAGADKLPDVARLYRQDRHAARILIDRLDAAMSS